MKARRPFSAYRAATEYSGPWPPWPQMYPVLVMTSSLLMTFSIWDKDVPRKTLEEDLADLLEEDSGAAPVHWGSVVEISQEVIIAMRHHSVVIDLAGTSKATQADFAPLLAEMGAIHVKVG